MDTIAWNLIDKYFKDNPYNLVAHHLDSYNDFFGKGIFQIFLMRRSEIYFNSKFRVTSEFHWFPIYKKATSCNLLL